MDKQQALKQLRIMQAWHEDNGDGPNADYDAICFAIEAIERSEDLEKLITALEQEHAKLREMQSATDINVGTKISREQLELARAIDGLTEWQKHVQTDSNINRDITIVIEALKAQLGTNLAEVGTRAVRGYPIDADALMEKVAEEYGERARDRLYQIIRYMPPAQPEQRRGVWIPVGVAEVVGGESAQWGSAIAYHKCSECDEQTLMDDFKNEVLSEFCPHCGAKMEGVAE